MSAWMSVVNTLVLILLSVDKMIWPNVHNIWNRRISGY